MITAVTHKPHTYTPGWGPIVWTVYSDNVTTSGFKYVFDIMLKGGTAGDTRIGRIKQPPNILGYASIDISTAVYPYLNPGEVLLEVDKITGATAGYKQTSDLVQGFYLLVGEEQNGILYSGLTGATGNTEPAFEAYSRDNVYVRAFTATHDIVQAQAHDVLGMTAGSTASYYGSFSSYVMSSSVPGKFLTSGVTSHDLRLQDHHTLTFLNRNIGITGDNASPGTLMITEYMGVTQTAQWWLDELVSTGAGPRIDNITAIGATSWTSPSQELSVIGVGPADLTLQSGASGADRYTVELQLRDKMTTVSDVHTFHLYDDCTGEFPTVRFSWLNKKGGRDYWNFNKFLQTQYGQKDSTYFKDPGQWSSDAWSLKPWISGDSVYKKAITKNVKVTSDWLTEVEKQHVLGLFESPSVLIYMPGDTIPQTCTIKESSYKDAYILADKMYNVTFSFDLSFGDRVQNC